MSDMCETENLFLQSFNDPEQVAKYSEGPTRFVPGLEALHRMTGLLLAEDAPADARVLVLGAGGGLELQALAHMHPDWTFVGVDPAIEMLRRGASWSQVQHATGCSRATIAKIAKRMKAAS